MDCLEKGGFDGANTCCFRCSIMWLVRSVPLNSEPTRHTRQPQAGDESAAGTRSRDLVFGHGGSGRKRHLIGGRRLRPPPPPPRLPPCRQSQTLGARSLPQTPRLGLCVGEGERQTLRQSGAPEAATAAKERPCGSSTPDFWAPSPLLNRAVLFPLMAPAPILLPPLALPTPLALPQPEPEGPAAGCGSAPPPRNGFRCAAPGFVRVSSTRRFYSTR